MSDQQALTESLEKARFLLISGRAAEALETLESIGRTRWKLAFYWVLRAETFLALNRPTEAVEAANWGLSIEPFSPLLFGLRYECEWACGRLSDAERSILEALRLSDFDPRYLSRYSALLAAAGQVDKALRVNADARTKSPDDDQLFLQAAHLEYLAGNDTAALGHARRAVALAPESAAAHLLLGGVTEEAVGRAAAIAPLRRTLELGLDDPLLRSSIQESIAVASHPAVRAYDTILAWVQPTRVLVAYGILLLALMALNYWKLALALCALFWLTQGYAFVAERMALRRANRRSAQKAGRSETGSDVTDSTGRRDSKRRPPA